ncbi:MAG: family 20 glycosylhydrolase [Clostridia bacterium]|nr:family 20 glycosylhydrolase [Clostridia bacterium]
MIFHPQHLVPTEGSFRIQPNVSAMVHSCLNKDVFREFWKGFTFQCSELHTVETEDFVFTVGNAQKIPLGGYAYSINIERNGICVHAESEKNLILGLMTLLDRIHAIDSGNGTAAEIDCCEIHDSPLTPYRMIHFCVFPETDLWSFRHFMRFCAALRFSHVVLEFWGMLQYDCLKELSWSSAFTKDQIKPIIREAKELGLEVIPMFNHWGHASASRVAYGKHVVLDQNPTLQSYFSEDGWCWAIHKPKVKELLRQVRNELTELCGVGSYFHIGCDEAFNFSFTRENMSFICDFINEINEEMAQQNRRIIIWGDMFLFQHEHYNEKNVYTCNAPSADTEEYMLNRLNKKIIIADWQYDALHAPVETALVFQKRGFDCLICPWDRGDNQLIACINTMKDHHLTGLLHTTWDTVHRRMPTITIAALGAFEGNTSFRLEHSRTHTAALWRKVMFANGEYEKAGWTKKQLGALI